MTSPFQKKHVVFEREKSTYESFRDYFLTKLNDMFLQYLPSDDIKAMSPEYLYPLGIIALVCLLGIFISIFLNGYYNAVKTEYLSPTDGDVASKHCVTIPTINTGSYLATETGFWQGADGFQFAEATYLLSATSLKVGVEQYRQVMNSAYINLQGVAELSEYFDLGLNLVYWMSGVFLPFSNNVAQRFYFVGTPLVVFDRQKIIGTMANVKGYCNASSVASFDNTNGKLVLHYDYMEYVNNPICMDIVEPNVLGYMASTDKNDFRIEMDVRSMITCVAVNLGLQGPDTLIRIPSFDSYLYYNNIKYNVTSYYDPKYSGMTPIYCVQLPHIGFDNGYVQCAMVIENAVYAVPIFNHAGENGNYPKQCNCTTLTYTRKHDQYDPCNIFSFISGVLYYPTDQPDELVALFFKLGLQTVNNIALISPINTLSFDPMFIDSYFGQESINRTLFDTPSYRNNVYNFCNNITTGSNQTCSFVIFSLFDKSPANWAVSPYYLQVQTGACQNTFVKTYAEWQALIAAPFAPLTQDYQKCHYDTSTVVINQAGSSVGTVSILAPICITVLLICVYLSQILGGVNIKKTYTNTEKTAALEDFAMKLLLVRDREPSRENKQQVLKSLVEELSEELEVTDNIYHDTMNHTGSSSVKDKVTVNWAGLFTAMNIKKKIKSSECTIEDGVSMQEIYTNSANRQIKSADSPLHKTAQLQRSGVKVMNEYELTSALLQQCSSSSSEQTNSKYKYTDYTAASGVLNPVNNNNAEVDITKVLALLDKLIAALETAAQEGGAAQSVWGLVSQTAILRAVHIHTLSAAESRAFYYRAYTLLGLHSAAVLNISLEEVKDTQQADALGYILGEQVLTLSELRQTLLGVL